LPPCLRASFAVAAIGSDPGFASFFPLHSNECGGAGASRRTALINWRFAKRPPRRLWAIVRTAASCSERRIAARLTALHSAPATEDTGKIQAGPELLSPASRLHGRPRHSTGRSVRTASPGGCADFTLTAGGAAPLPVGRVGTGSRPRLGEDGFESKAARKSGNNFFFASGIKGLRAIFGKSWKIFSEEGLFSSKMAENRGERVPTWLTSGEENSYGGGEKWR
jgi:hypothetical protein